MGNAAKSVRLRRCPYCGTVWQVNATGLMEHLRGCRFNPDAEQQPKTLWYRVRAWFRKGA